MWGVMMKAKRMSPPPTGSNKRPKKTARGFWEWFRLDGVTADHVQAAFKYWEKTGGNSYFRVESKVYSKITNWTCTEKGTPVTELLPEPPPVVGSGRSWIQDMKSRWEKK